jgi:hypothetical protein
VNRRIDEVKVRRPAELAIASSMGASDPALGKGGTRRILIALAQYDDGLSATKLSLLTGISRSGGTWRTYMALLKGKDYVRQLPDRFHITREGRTALGAYDPLPTGEALLQYWRSRLGNSGKRRLFDVVVGIYPSTIGVAQLGLETGIDPAGGTWRTYIAELRGLELIVGRGELQANPDLFLTAQF